MDGRVEARVTCPNEDQPFVGGEARMKCDATQLSQERVTIFDARQACQLPALVFDGDEFGHELIKLKNEALPRLAFL